MRKQPEFVHQFLVVLSGTDPLVWRRIQVPLAYTFWDLHVAIQDAMGWLDYHLHEFRFVDTDKVATIGIPTDEEPEQRPCRPELASARLGLFQSPPDTTRFPRSTCTTSVMTGTICSSTKAKSLRTRR